jgi:hypothetical protein
MDKYRYLETGIPFATVLLLIKAPCNIFAWYDINELPT